MTNVMHCVTPLPEIKSKQKVRPVLPGALFVKIEWDFKAYSIGSKYS